MRDANCELSQTLSSIASRAKVWNRIAKAAFVLHYASGVVGIGAACIAGTGSAYAPAAGSVAAVCFGIFGFVQPMRIYHQRMKAWRVVDDAVLRYKNEIIDLEALLNAVAQAEQIIESLEIDIYLKHGSADTLQLGRR